MAVELLQGDCLELMPTLPDGCADMILCDLPYGTTACKWDSVIPFEPLWEQYRRLIKPGGVIVLTASQPFTAALVMSNPKWFRYELVWDKVNRYTGYMQANVAPLRRHENVLIFGLGAGTYNKQYRNGIPYRAKRTGGKGKHYGDTAALRLDTNNDGRHNPCTVLPFEGDIKREMGLHPTQKPVALFEYLIRTYTHPDELVLDNCAGSGTTGVAALNTGRRAILIEREPEYCDIIRRRLADTQPELMRAA